MSRILCTFPGRHGDILWSLPTVRAISESAGQPVDLQIGQEYAGGFVDLLRAQPYLGDVKAREGWVGDRGVLEEGWQAPEVGGYDQVFHLGYRRWPTAPLPMETNAIARVDRELPPLDLTRPWITVPATDRRRVDAGYRHPRQIAVGFTDEYFETKYGLYKIVDEHDYRWDVRTCCGKGRWFDEVSEGGHSWIEGAQMIQQAGIFLGCCSALHVLAVAIGTPVVAMEPHKDRWNGIFWPCGTEGPQVTLVRGLDGQPTFDARHVCDAIEQALGRIKESV